jgi:hypothetical protein
MNLENSNLVELNALEIEQVEGGNIFRRMLEIASIYDAFSDFGAGWNSVESYSRVSTGSW